MSKLFGGFAPVQIKRETYAMASVDGKSAELEMYGIIYEQWPIDPQTGEQAEGQFILLSEFMKDIDRIASCKKLTIRMNSYGGDATVSLAIHNRLRELSRGGMKIIGIVDAVAMSGGSLILCACDKVIVNPSSVIMIHDCLNWLFGWYNRSDLQEELRSAEAYDKAQAAIYHRKTGLDEAEISQMMNDTTFLTGREAVEKGFADEILEDAEPVNIAASADGRSLFVNGRQMHLAAGMFAPDIISTVTPEALASVKTNITNQPEATGEETKGGIPMASNIEELRAEYPELVAQVEAEATDRANFAARSAAVETERQRLQEIDEMSDLFDSALVQEAKYGATACSAQELAFRAAQKAKTQGAAFLANLETDAQASGVADVGTISPVDDGEGVGRKNTVEQARADARAFNDRRKEIR